MIELLKIKDFASVITGGTPSTAKNEYWNGGSIPWLNSGELNQDIITSTRNYITEKGLQNSSTRLMPADSVLIALTGSTTGVVGYLTFEACANQSVSGVLPSDKHFPKYLYYFLKSIRKKIVSDAYGGAQPHISQGYIKELQIPLPPLPTQQKIAAILDAADAYRQKTKALIAKYDELTQSLFLDMFGDPVKNEKGWEKRKLNDFLNTLVDVGSNGGNDWVSANIKMKDEEDYAIMIRTVNLNKNDFNNNLKYVSEETYNLFKKTKVFGGEIIMNKIGSAGEFWLMPNLNKPVSLGLNQLMMKFNDLEKLFFYYYFSTDFGKKLINSKLNGATTKSITKTALRELDILYPPITLQNQFAERVQAIEEQKAQAQASLEKAEELFNSLLQRAFKGELV